MAKVRTVDFLPEIFQTPVNRQFLNATLDQLVQEPSFKKTQGFVGRKVGPGVNPADRYVVEPTASRNNYQLEPGVVEIDPENSKQINDAITYPGITDTLNLNGADVSKADRLYTSEFYTFDPFVDFDKFSNFSQYYWLPAGPLSVDVSATSIPLTDDITVTRADGVYTFSGVSGSNPALTLVRGGNYNFNVAQNNKETVNFRVTNQANSAYVIDYQNNPTLTLVRGNTYVFNLILTGVYPFYIKTEASLGNVNTYDTGVLRNGATNGIVTFTVPQDAPDTLYYSSANEFNMRGQINVIDGTPGTGPGFWIQVEPGVNGVLSYAPNISSRGVLGVINNGEDLGTVTFDVPVKDAQNFYYTLTDIGTVDLITDLQFDQINNQTVTAFLENNPTGIDGITNLNNRTVVFLNQNLDPESGGWLVNSLFDPLAGIPSNNGVPGSFDSITFDQTTPVPPDQYYNVWQIQYVNGIIKLNNIETVSNLEKFTISFGTEYSSTQWYKDAEGFFEEIPLLSAIRDVLYYQDGTDPEIFGQIRLIDPENNSTINVDTDILGHTNYVSPNGVTFTNGLKVVFRGNVVPAIYENNEYYVEGVGTAIKLLPVSNFVTPETYTQSGTVPYDSTAFDVGNFDATLNAPIDPDYLTINRASPDLNPWTRSNRWFHVDVINASAAYNNTQAVVDNLQRAKRPILEYCPGTRLFNFGTEGIQPIDIIDFSQTDALSNVNGSVGYGVDGYTFINGTRVIFAADTDPEVRNQVYTVQFIEPTVYPLLTVTGIVATGTTVTYSFIPGTPTPYPVGSTVKIYGVTPSQYNGLFTVTSATTSTITVASTATGTYTNGGAIASEVVPIIDLIPAATNPVLINQSTVCLSGQTLQGKSFYYDGVEWLPQEFVQQKTKTNQAPLFDVYDADGISYSNRAKYPSSTFTGSKLFSYATPTTAEDNTITSILNDPVLGFQLTYLSLNNVGDIVFDNNLYKDTFVYAEGSVGVTQAISDGFVREYSDRVTYKREIGWQTAVTKSISRQQIQFVYNGKPLLLDVKVNTNNVVPAIQLYVNGQFQAPANYAVLTTDTTTTITLNSTYTGADNLTAVYVDGDVIEVDVLSDQASATGFYQVPTNLENNPLNNNSTSFTLGTLRNHYGTICQNLLQLQGPINGANNTRDLGNIIPYGQQILQQSSPMTLAGYFMRSQEYDIFASLSYNDREYIKYKSKLLETVANGDYGSLSIPEILDSAIAEITLGRTNLNPFYWSDMLPTGSIFTQTRTVITSITTNVFNTTQTYDFTTSNYLGLLVYLNPAAAPGQTILLERGPDYTVSTLGPTVTVNIDLAVGDVITICEYSNTAGSFCPNTPSKLGLYPKFLPRLFYDTNYVNPVPVIQGHDGSITVAFGDYRDDVLLEFEKRIYNNIKTDDNPIPLTVDEVIPGFFRTTDYTQAEVTNILGESFLNWVGWNKLDYKAQDYNPSNPFTYNYSSAGSKLLSTKQVSNINEEPLLGAWRGIYRYFYDTTSPNYTPWEMLGFSEMPSWWETRYGPAPYTSDNLVLWDDLANGYVADPTAPYIRPEYVRQGLQNVIPVSTEGQLLNPLESIVGQYDPNDFQKSWQVGDGGPVEAAWWTSSSYPFAVMRLLALTRPAEFFSLFADRDDYRYNAELGQYLFNGRYRLDANGIPVYGNGNAVASYINWIVDYNQQLGIDSTTALTTALKNLDVRLCYRMASFTDKQYLKIYTERSSPNSLNSSLLLPDESYNLLFYKNQPFAHISYSALIIERVADGYAVFGYSTVNPYFTIFVSSTNGILQTVEGGGATVRVPAQYTQNLIQVPYGYTFKNTTMVVDFILSYGKYLESQGLIFNDQENGYTLNWNQMATEFLYFSQQGWTEGTLINLNPVATTLKASRPGAVVDTIISTGPENQLLDQNRGTLPTRDLVVERYGNDFSITSTTNQTISYLELRFTTYENMVVLDNVSIFNDLLYDPTTAARQTRVKVVGATTTDWVGEVDTHGFILNQPNVKQWQPYIKYTKGEIVVYKNQYWQAASIVQPKANFDFNDWYKSNYQLIQPGLLPNIANKADQLANSYNINTANLERDNDLLAYGLIGFRPRDYMAALNLDDVTQVNLYQQFLGTKGTNLAAEIFTRADLGKETGEYLIYENWGVLAATYGANANRSFYELQLNEADLSSDPATVQVIQPGESSLADQTVFLNNVWRESYKLTSTDILPTTYDTNQDTALPSAGYVDLTQVDITCYSIDDPSSIAANIDIVGVGTTIWVAKVNNYDWGIYRCADDPGTIYQVQDNLNGTAIAYFTKAHGLKIGDLIIIKYFAGNQVNGVYRVLGVPSIDSITLAISLYNTSQTTLTGTGLVFYLESKRVSQASDIVNLSYAKDLDPGATVWVDNNGLGQWEVLQKQQPFTQFQELVPLPPVSNSRFGSSISQSLNHFGALVGMPGNGTTDAGVVHTYRRSDDTSYLDNVTLELNAPDVVGYGFSTDFGGANWAVASAPFSNNGMGYINPVYQVPGSNNYRQGQLLVPPDQDFNAINFGYSVAISENERWMYVSAPVRNRVYAYGLVDVEAQNVSYVADGVTVSFNYSDYCVIDSNYPEQLSVTVDNFVSVYQLDYTVTGSSVIFSTAPTAGLVVRISRRDATQLDQQVYFNVLPDSQTGTGSGAVFTVTNTRGVYSPSLTNPGLNYQNGDTITISYTQICPAGTSANDLTITVTSTYTGGVINTFTASGSGITNTATFLLNTSLYTANNIYAFTVLVDGEIQRPHIDYDFNNDSTESTYDLTFESGSLPAAGAVITVVAGTYWQYLGTLPTPSTTAGNSLFGAVLSTGNDGRQVIVGAPREVNDSVANSGAAYVFDRSVIAYQITDTTQTTYAITGSFSEPIGVLLNGQYLTNTEFYINGQYTLVGSDVVLSSAVVLTVGDILEIETNQFQLLERLAAEYATPQATEYGSAVKISHNENLCFVGAPKDTNIAVQCGSIYTYVNQAKKYGVITSTIANPTLTAGDTIRVNNFEVAVPNSPDQTIEGLVAAINAANIPNAIASLTSDLTLVGNGYTKIFDVGSIYSAASSYTTVVYVDDALQISGVDYTYNSTAKQINFITAPGSNSVIKVISGRMTITVKNALAADPIEKLTVLPGVIGSAFEDLGFDLYPIIQEIQPPQPFDFAYFGSSIDINTDGDSLVVGAPNGTVIISEIFDRGQTIFDERSTTFFDPIINSGVVYTYDLLPSANSSVSNPDQFVFGQQIYSSLLASNDQFGAAVNYTSGRLLVGSPGSDFGDSSVNYGNVYVFDNPDDLPVWSVVRIQEPQVDVALINTIYTYDKLLSKTTTYFDYINPLQGKILGAARRNIDYIGAVDPAQYNIGTVHNNGNSWAVEHLGEIWWDTDTVRFINPNQDDIVYASRRWGQIFPGSRVDVYQWIGANVPPAQYTGAGIPLSLTSYSVNTALNKQNIFETTYYFWVRGINTIESGAGKTLSTVGIASYIESPRTSGIPYIAALNSSTVALYNASSLISAQDTILHIGFDRQAEGGDNNIHQEFQFVADGRPASFLNDTLYRKLQDSFCGVDSAGAAVPDTTLSPAERYGVQFRPRQTMFADRYAALKNYLTRVNSILLQYPIVESRSLSLLNSSEPEPTPSSDAWNKRVANLEELSYQNLDAVPDGYRYLVVSDSGQQGRWTIYEVIGEIGFRSLSLVRIQNYVTPLYWYHTNWYLPGYNISTRALIEVPNRSALDTVTIAEVPIGGSARVAANGQGKFEVYIRTATGWDRVGLQDGTVQFKEELWNYSLGNFGFDVEVFDAQYFDQEPVIETRKIIQAINEELLIDDLLIARNQCLILMFNFVYSEFATPDWLIKTSLIDVEHKIRALKPYQIYQQDNQTFVLDYIQEVKPYHVQVREFNLAYYGEDTYLGNLTDFDVPAYWNTALTIPQYISPVLLPYDHANTTTQSDTSDASATAEIWTLEPWKQWFNNYLLSIQDVTVTNGGSGYLTPPDVTVSAPNEGGTQAILTATINSAGQVIAITIVNPGSGYSVTPTITIDSSGNGDTAVAVALMGNDLVRSIKTVIKYDRCEYVATVTEWSPFVASYPAGTLVRYADKVWSANTTITNTPITISVTGLPDTYVLTTSSTAGISSGMIVTGSTIVAGTEVVSFTGTTITLTKVLLSNVAGYVNFYDPFNTDSWTLVDPSTLSGANRTMGYYLPTADQPGLELPLLINGISYPGVQVTGPLFTQNTGFDVGNFDINPFDNISIDENGLPTYDYGILDTFYASYYGTAITGPIPTGTAVTDINVDGGAYIDTYSSHAPEELVPGAEFDTLDMRIYSTPGADWENDGHGFPEEDQNYIFNPLTPTLPFVSDYDAIPAPVSMVVTNVTQTHELLLGIDYTVNWVDQTITIINGTNAGDLIQLTTYGLGGGNQLFKQLYNGADIGNSLVIPIQYTLIQELAIFVNGVYLPVQLNDSTENYSYTAENSISTLISFNSTYTINDAVVIVAIGPTTVGSSTVDYSWSTPQTQVITGVTGQLAYTLTNSLEYSNPDNMVVTVNGVRARTSAGAEYYADGSTGYLLPQRLGFNQSIITDNEIHVYVNDVPQQLNVDFVVEPYDPLDSGRSIDFITTPTVGERILVCVDTNAQCTIVNSNQVQFNATGGLVPSNGDNISVTTFNDTRQQNILTQVFVGPITSGATVTENYDETTYDEGAVTGSPGSFDYAVGVVVTVNDLVLEHTIVDPTRLWVTLNGNRLIYGNGFTLVNNEIILNQILGPTDVVMVTEFTESLVPESMAFRIFQDMRGVQSIYRITPATTTTLAQPLSSTADIIYVTDATALSQPDVDINIWGVITINGERIMYRERNTVNNTVSSLLRGTAGTSAADHSTGTDVYDMSISNLLPEQYQNYIVSNIDPDTRQYPLGDGSTVTFTADAIDLGTAEDSTDLDLAVEVYVGGTLLINGTDYTITATDPVSVLFDVAPASGSAVTILVRRGVDWYTPGAGTPSNGIALQDTNNPIARFLRGE